MQTILNLSSSRCFGQTSPVVFISSRLFRQSAFEYNLGCFAVHCPGLVYTLARARCFSL